PYALATPCPFATFLLGPPSTASKCSQAKGLRWLVQPAHSQCCWHAKAATRRFVCAPVKSAAYTLTAVQPLVQSATLKTACAKSARRVLTAGAVSVRAFVVLP